MEEMLPFLMLPAAFVLMFLGVQVMFAMMITAVLFGMVTFGDRVVHQFIEKIDDLSSNFVFAAVPLFVFMGAMLEKSGIADRLFEAIHIWTRRLPGGLALATVLMCIIFAASSGVIGATESVVGLLTIPIMLRYGYSKALISGTICAGGSLGTIIPPSVVVVVMGPLADLSVGDLMYGMVFPGLIMAGLYLIYILVLCILKPQMGPRIPPRARTSRAFGQKLRISTVNLLPPVFMIFAVLGSILLGWASPTEAAAIGALCSVLLTILYGQFSLAGPGRGAGQDGDDHRHDHGRAARRHALHRRLHRRRRHQHGQHAHPGDEAVALDAALPDDVHHLPGGVLPRLDLDRADLHPDLHAADQGRRLRSGLVLHPVPDHDPDQLPDAADGAGDLLPARGRAAGDHASPTCTAG